MTRALWPSAVSEVRTTIFSRHSDSVFGVLGTSGCLHHGSLSLVNSLMGKVVAGIVYGFLGMSMGVAIISIPSVANRSGTNCGRLATSSEVGEAALVSV